MEWVERADRTVDAAKDFLLDQLGVDEADAEFEILEEPKPGLFGRVRGQARVRARVAPRSPRVKEDRRRRSGKKSDKSGGDDQRKKQRPPASEKPAPSPAKQNGKQQGNGGGQSSNAGKAKPAEASTAAPKEPTAPAPAPVVDPEPFIAPLTGFLDQLVAAFGLTGSTTVEVVDGELEARIDGDGLGRLIGPAGGVITAVQELSRTFLQKVAKGGSAPRLRVDVGGYRADRRAALAAFTAETAAAVVASGRAHRLEPMGSVDRKVVHDAAATVEGVVTRSAGDDPDRYVVITPA